MKTATSYLAFAAILATQLGLAASNLPAASAEITGEWEGSGSAKLTDGERERVRCRISYQKQSNKTFAIRATCASPSAKVTQTGTILRATTNTYVGSLFNPDYKITARVRIRVSGNNQTVTMTADEVTGSVKLKRR